MEWNDDAVVLATKPFGETAVILEVLTVERGRHAGMVRAGTSKRMKGVLEPGNQVRVHWRARLDDQLGSFTIELERARAQLCFSDGMKLSALNASCGLILATLPEREAHERVFQAFDGLIDKMIEAQDHQWLETYVRFELMLMKDLGFGLDLSKCASTGQTHDLAYVSPKTGRAVSQEAGAPYQKNLLILPRFLGGGTETSQLQDYLAGLTLTGFFLERFVLSPHGGQMPAARVHFAERLAGTARDR